MAETVVTDRILTIPNIVSFIRLLTVPVFWWLLLGEENVGASALLIGAVAWTDWIDGYLARRLNQVSTLGKVLDPIADRLMIVSAVVGGLIADIVPGVIGIPLMAREAFMAIVAIVMVSRGAGTLTVRYLGKFATAAVYSSIPAFYFAEAEIFENIFWPFAWFTGVIGLATYIAVAVVYVGDARRALADVKSRRAREES